MQNAIIAIITTITIDAKTFPAAFAAMDEAASQFWAYPDIEWQEQFLLCWARENDPVLAGLLGEQ